MKKDETTNKF